MCGAISPARAQDPAGAPFASADATADPFSEVGAADKPAATSFQPDFGASPSTDPGAAPAAAASPSGAAATTDAVALLDAAADAGTATAPPVAATQPADASFSPFGSPEAGATAAAPPTEGQATAATGNTANGGKGISQLFEFRYVPSATFNGRKIVTRKQMTRDEAAAFDTAVAAEFAKLAEEEKLPNKRFTKGANAQEWGQWMLYAFQLDNWSIYCRDVALGGTGFKFDPEKDIHWPGDPSKSELDSQAGAGEFSEGGGKGGGRPERPQNIYNENRSLDDQVMDFVPVPDTRGGQNQASAVVDPKQMDDQAKEIYNKFLTALRAEEQRQTEFLKKLAGDIDQRARDRDAYAEWRNNQKRIVLDYVNDWNRRYEGKVVTVAGVRYELYKPGTVPASTTRFANIVVTDYELTPYDLLNEDGSLRGPAK
ncbi:hypothetical protein IT570_12515 [Candidatus Sumerlaeota bacterium]|nr:hypothetical protein [Candidatus Sumerlaeota bacterium]